MPTDNDIKKALEWCEQFENNIVSMWKSEDKYILALKTMQTIRNVLNDYNRLQAENERLKNTLDDVLDREPLLVERSEKYAKAEAYKECIEKVEEIICDNTYPDFDINHKAVNIWKAEAYKNIDNLLKKLIGE